MIYCRLVLGIDSFYLYFLDVPFKKFFTHFLRLTYPKCYPFSSNSLVMHSHTMSLPFPIPLVYISFFYLFLLHNHFYYHYFSLYRFPLLSLSQLPWRENGILSQLFSFPFHAITSITCYTCTFLCPIFCCFIVLFFFFAVLSCPFGGHWISQSLGVLYQQETKK